MRTRETLQDRIERYLYSIGLTLNGEKTKVLRSDTALARLEPAKERFEEKKEAWIEDLLVGTEDDPYVDPTAIPDPEDVEREVVIAEFDRLVGSLGQVDLPRDFHADARQVLGQLEAIEEPHGLSEITPLLRRAPDLTDQALRYVVAVAESDPDKAATVFTSLLSREHPGRDHERLIASHRALSLPEANNELGKRLGQLAIADDHPLVRAKALVAWGRHTRPRQVAVADQFLARAEPQWRPYAFVALQRKTKKGRRRRYAKWGGGGGLLGKLSAALEEGPIKWSKL